MVPDFLPAVLEDIPYAFEVALTGVDLSIREMGAEVRIEALQKGDYI